MAVADFVMLARKAEKGSSPIGVSRGMGQTRFRVKFRLHTGGLLVHVHEGNATIETLVAEGHCCCIDVPVASKSGVLGCMMCLGVSCSVAL